MRTFFALVLFVCLVACTPTTLPATVPPSDTPPPSFTPKPRATPTPSPSPTPRADAAARAEPVTLYAGPGKHFPPAAQAAQGEGLVVHNRTRDCSWLEVENTGGETGWVQREPGEIDLNLDCDTIPLGTITGFPNGVILIDKRTEIGPIELFLKITNTGNPKDVFVLLVNSEGSPFYGCYVQANKTATLEQIPKGAYQLFLTDGSDWDTRYNIFTQDATYARSVKPVRFDFTFIYHSNLMRTWYASLIVPDRLQSLTRDTAIHFQPSFVEGSASKEIELAALSPEEFPALEILIP